MALQPQFRQLIIRRIEEMAEQNLQRANVQDDSEEKRVWKYEHSFDYHYGRTNGMLIRMLRDEFEKFHQRNPTEAETYEIIKIMDENSYKIRHSLAYLKDPSKPRN